MTVYENIMFVSRYHKDRKCALWEVGKIDMPIVDCETLYVRGMIPTYVKADDVSVFVLFQEPIKCEVKDSEITCSASKIID